MTVPDSGATLPISASPRQKTVTRIFKKAFAAFCALAFLAQQVGATTFTVTSTAGDCSANTLCAAIQASNSAGGTNIINFNIPGGGTINLAQSLPVIASNVTIDATNGGAAGDAITLNGQGLYQIFTVGNSVGTVSVTIQSATADPLVVENGLAQGGNGGNNTGLGGGGGGGGLGAGGALLVNSNATVTIDNVDLNGNKAQGGNGGVGATTINTGTGAGGGGLNGGNGGATTGGGSSGGGGWGQGATGGNDTASTNGSAGVCAGASCGPGGNGGTTVNGATTGGANGGGGGAAAGNSNGYPAAGGGGVNGGVPTIPGGTGLGGAGGFGGGGGGGQNGGAGGFGGGGGGSSSVVQWTAGTGGFGAGGGGGGTANSTSLAYGGSGDAAHGDGGGGAGLGGAVFVAQGGNLTIENGGLGANTSSGGNGGGGSATAGQGVGGAMFLMSGVSANYSVGAAQTSAIASSIAGTADGGLVFTGPGQLNLTAANTYTGGTQIAGSGTLGITADTNLGAASGGITFNGGGGTLQLQSSNISSNRSITLASNGAIDTDANTGESLSGAISGAGALTVKGGGALTLNDASPNSYTGGTTITGAGTTLSISEDNNLGTGAMTLDNGGALKTTAGLTDARAITLSNGGGAVDTDGNTTTLNGSILGSGGLTVEDTTAGSGLLVLGGSNNYSGGTTLKSGVLDVSSAGNLGTGGLTFNGGTLGTLAGFNLGAGVGITMAGAGTVNLNGFASTFAGNMAGAGGLTVMDADGQGAGSLTLSGSNGGYSGPTTVSNATLNISADSDLGSGALTLKDGGALQTTSSLTDSRSVTLTSGLSGTGGTINTGGQPSTFSGAFGGSGSLTVDGGGKLVLSNATNSYAGGTTVSGNGTVLSISNDNDLGAGALALSGGAALQTTAGVTDGRAVTLSGAGGGVIDVDGQATTFNGAIGGSGGLTVADTAGGGKLTLSDTANNYAGGTTIANGAALSVGNDAELGATGAGNGLTFIGGTLQTTTGITSARAISLGSGGGTIDTTNASDIFSGAVSGGGALTKNGSGTLTLSDANNNYTGGTIVNAGTLAVAGTGALGTGNLALDGGSTLQTQGAFVSGNTVSIAGGAVIDADGQASSLFGQISGAGGLNVTDTAGGGKVSLSGPNNYTGGTTVSAGAILGVAADGSLGNAAGSLTLNASTLQTQAGNFTSARGVTISGGATLDADGFSTTAAGFSGMITGSGGLTVTDSSAGGGQVALSGATNNYTGGTTVQNGATLEASVDSNLGATGVGNGLTLNNGTLLAQGAAFNSARSLTLGAGGGTVNVANAARLSGAIAGGALAVDGGGTLTLSDAGANTYSGGTTVSGIGTTLSISADNNLGTAGLTLSNGGSLATTAGLTDGRAVTIAGTGGIINTSGQIDTFNGAFGGAGGLTVDGGGRLNLTAANSNYAGGTTVSGGTTLGIASDGSLGAAGAGNGLSLNASTLQTQGVVTSARSVTLAGGSTIDADGQSSSFSGKVAGAGGLAITDTAGGGIVSLTGTGNNYTGGTTVANAVLGVDADGSLGDVSGGLSLTASTLRIGGTVTSNRTVTLAGGSLIDAYGHDSSFLGGIGGAGGLTVEDTSSGGGGVVSLTGTANNYTGGTTVDAGAVLAVDGDGSLGATGVGNGVTINGGTMRFQSANFTSARTMAVAGGATLDADAQSSSWSGNIGGSGGLTITDSSAGGGKIVLGGNNSYVGGTLVQNSAVLAVSADSNLGSGGAGNGVTLNNGTLLAQGAAFSSARSVALGAGGGTVNVANAATLSGAISGGALSVDGGGTLTLADASANGYGNTTVSGVNTTLAISADNNLGTGSLILSNGGALRTTASLTDGHAVTLAGTGGIINTSGKTDTFNGAFSGSGGLTVDGAGTLDLTASSNYAGGTTVSGGTTLGITNDDNLGATGVGNGLTLNASTLQTQGAVNSARNVALSGGSSIDADGQASAFSGQIGGAGGLTVEDTAGGGVVSLTNTTNLYTGGTTVTNAALGIGSDGSLGDSSGALTLNASTLKTLGAVNSSRAVAISGASMIDADGQASSFAGKLSGAGALTVTDSSGGNGFVSLTDAANNYAGGTTISGGAALGVSADGALGSGGLAFNNGTLQTQASLGIDNRAVNFAGKGTIDTDLQSSTLGGALSGAGNLSVIGGGTLALSHDNSAAYSGNISVSGNSTLSVSNDNQFGSGTLALSAGTLATTSGIVDARAISLAGAGNSIATGGNASTFNGLLADGAAAGSLTINGGGSVTLGDAGNSYSGGTTVTGNSTLALANDGALGAGALALNSGTLSTTSGITDSRAISLSGAANTIATAGHNSSFNGLIADGGSSGGLAVNGGGTVTLGDAANSYTGGTTVSGNSTLTIGNDHDLGSGGALALNNGTLATTAGIAAARALNLSGNDTLATAGFSSSFAGSASGSGSLTINGGGSVLLSGNNSGFSGNTDVTANSLLAVNNGNALGSSALTLDGATLQTQAAVALGNTIALTSNNGTIDADGKSSTLSGKLSGLGALAVTDTSGGNNGVITLTNATNNYSGGTTITGGGTVGVTADGALGSSGVAFNNGTLQTQASLGTDNRAFTFAGKGTVDTDGQSSTLAGTLSGAGNLSVLGGGTLALSANNSATYSGNVSVSGNSTLSVSNDNQFGSGSRAHSGGSLATTSGIVDARAISLSGGGNAFATGGNTSSFSGLIADGASAGSLAVTGGGTVLLGNASNSYSGGTTVSGNSTLAITADGDLGAGAVTLNGATLQTRGAVNSAHSITVGGGGILDADGHASSFSGAIGGSGGLIIADSAGGGKVSLANASNNYTGGTLVSNAVLGIVNDGNLGAASAGNGLTLSHGTLQLQSNVSSGRAISLNSTGGTLDLDGNTSNLGSLISGTGKLTLVDTSVGGNGQLTLTDANNGYTGGTEVDAGTLNVDNDAELGGSIGGVTLNGGTLSMTKNGFSSARSFGLGAGGGTLQTAGTGNLAAISGAINGSGALSVTGGGALTLSGANGYAGGTTIGANTIVTVGNSGALGSGSVMIGNSATLQAGTNATLSNGVVLGPGDGTGGGAIDTANGTNVFNMTLLGKVSGGALTKIDGGTLLLQNTNNDYQGGTNFNGGVLAVLADGNLGAASGGLTFNGGALQIVGTNSTLASSRSITINSGGGTVDTNGNNAILSGTIGGTGGLTKNGAGTLTLGNPNNYGGSGTFTTVNQGTLKIFDDSALGNAASGVSLNGGALQAAANLSSNRAIAIGPNGGSIDTDGNNAVSLSGAISGSGKLFVVDSTRSSGALTLTSTNNTSFSGGTEIDSGLLKISAAGALGTGNITLNGGTLETTADTTFGNGQTVTITGAGGTINTDPNLTVIQGQISGSGALGVSGGGVLQLSNTNSYAGGTIVAANTTVGVNSDASLGTGSLQLLGGILQTTGAMNSARSITIQANGAVSASVDTDGNSSTFAGPLGGSGGLVVTDSTKAGGKLNLTGNNSYIGGTTVQGNATLGVSGETSMGAGVGVGGTPNGLTLNQGTLRTLSSMSSARPISLGVNSGIIDTFGNAATLTGAITGTGGLTKVGLGTLVLDPVSNANTYTGGTTVTAGTLLFGNNNALPTVGALNMAAGTTLNTGTNSQTLGSYLGTAGNGATPGTTLAVSPVTATTPNITVTGNATLTGTNLSVDPAHPEWVQNGQTFIPFHAGLITGQFAAVQSPIIELIYNPTYPVGNSGDVVVTASLLPLASFAGTSNQASVANGLEPLRLLASPTNPDASAVVAGLYSLNQSQLQTAFDQIGPISLASLSGVTFAAAGAHAAAVAQRMAGLQMADPDAGPPESFAYYKVSGQSSTPGAVMAYSGDNGGAPFGYSPEQQWSVFASGVDTFGHLDSQSGSGGMTPGYSFNAGGATFGTDYRFNDHYVAGFSGGYIAGGATVDQAMGNVSNQSVRYGAYGTAYNGAFHANLYAGGAQDTYTTNRNVSFGGISRTATGGASGGELNADASVGYDVPVSPVTVSPFADLAFDSLTINPYTETGAQSLDLSVARQTAQSMRASVGSRVTWKYVKSEQTSFLPYFSLGLEHEFDNQSRAIGAQFAGTGTAFAVQTADVARSGVIVGTGVTASWGGGFSTRLDYAGDFRSNFNSQSVQGTVHYRF